MGEPIIFDLIKLPSVDVIPQKLFFVFLEEEDNTPFKVKSNNLKTT